MNRRHLVLILGFALVALLGYKLAETAAVPRDTVVEQKKSEAPPKQAMVIDEPAPRFRKGERVSSFRSDDEALAAGAIPGQRTLAFASQAALEDFLKRAGDKIRVMGRLDALNALKVGFLNYDDLAALLGGDEELSLVFPVEIPSPGNGMVQDGAVALGNGLLDWLGITGDNSTWGSGVRVAVLDTGVAASRAFSSKIFSSNIVAMPSDTSAQNGHGTAVASMIIGQNSLTPGVAPGAEILSIRIADDNGRSTSFELAQGIVAAVDGGASLINISMGSFGDSALVRNAIAYAQAAGALIIAAAGNNGSNSLSYPAANQGVIAVGAVDAVGNHLDFSNSGDGIALSAPGYGVNAAWTGNQAASVSGTSFSAPIVTGVLAAVKSWPANAKLSMRQVADLVFSYLNDAGAEGSDTAIGAGTPDIGRILNAKTRGIYDAALASQRFLPAETGGSSGSLEVMVQNRGTEPLVNTSVQISTPTGVITSNITSLPVNAVKVIRIPATRNADGGVSYNSQVNLSGGVHDSKPSNDRRSQTYVPPVSK